MHLYPTTALARMAAKTLKEMNVELTSELAELLNSEFSAHAAKFSEKEHLRRLVGKFYQNRATEFFGGVQPKP